MGDISKNMIERLLCERRSVLSNPIEELTAAQICFGFGNEKWNIDIEGVDCSEEEANWLRNFSLYPKWEIKFPNSSSYSISLNASSNSIYNVHKASLETVTVGDGITIERESDVFQGWVWNPRTKIIVDECECEDQVEYNVNRSGEGQFDRVITYRDGKGFEYKQYENHSEFSFVKPSCKSSCTLTRNKKNIPEIKITGLISKDGDVQWANIEYANGDLIKINRDRNARNNGRGAKITYSETSPRSTRIQRWLGPGTVEMLECGVGIDYVSALAQSAPGTYFGSDEDYSYVNLDIKGLQEKILKGVSASYASLPECEAKSYLQDNGFVTATEITK